MDFQGSLFEAPADQAGRGFAELERIELSAGAWVDVHRAWVPAPDEVLAALIGTVPWRAERRQMYDRVVDVPRLVHTYGPGEELPHLVLERSRDDLSEHYLPELREPFVSAGCCFYRDGRDSVAWHGDTIGRGRSEDTLVAILSFGDLRRLALRPRTGVPASPGGRSISIELAHGDLVVMGGSCQRTWEHAVPKVAHAGPRVSVQFRPLNVF